MITIVRNLAVLGAALALAGGAGAGEPITLKVLGQPVGSGLIQKNMEQPFFEGLPKTMGGDVTVEYRPVDTTGMKDTDGLRLLKSGLFDIVSIRGPQVSRDEPMLLGLDLVGQNPSYADGKASVAAFSSMVDKRLQAQFNTKLLGLWPAGPQVVFCKPAIAKLDDLKGLKVRVGDQSMASFIGTLGATAVPLPFGEVQQALSRGVVDCAITGPASANSAGWPDVTTHVLELPLQLAMNGYGVNLATWKKLSPADQAKLEKAVADLTGSIWAYSEKLYVDASNCNAGKDPCETGKKYALKTVTPSTADLATVKGAVKAQSFPNWAKVCDANNKACSAEWKETVGKRFGF